MKYLIIISALNFLFATNAIASGCDHYDTYLKVTADPRVKELKYDDYKLEALTDKTVTLRNKATSKLLNLEWMKTDFFQQSSNSAAYGKDIDYIEAFYGQDVEFTEAISCGPIMTCITGQIVLEVANPKKGEKRTFTYPKLYARDTDGFDRVYGAIKLLVPFNDWQPPRYPEKDQPQCSEY